MAVSRPMWARALAIVAFSFSSRRRPLLVQNLLRLMAFTFLGSFLFSERVWVLRPGSATMSRSAIGQLPGGVLYHPPVQLGSEPMDLAGQLCVGFELQFLLGEVVVRLGLLERRLPVLAD